MLNDVLFPLSFTLPVVVVVVVVVADENLAEGSEAWLVRDKLIAKRDRRIQRRLINLGSKSIQDKIDQVFEGKRR